MIPDSPLVYHVLPTTGYYQFNNDKNLIFFYHLLDNFSEEAKKELEKIELRFDDDKIFKNYIQVREIFKHDQKLTLGNIAIPLHKDEYLNERSTWIKELSIIKDCLSFIEDPANMLIEMIANGTSNKIEHNNGTYKMVAEETYLIRIYILEHTASVLAKCAFPDSYIINGI